MINLVILAVWCSVVNQGFQWWVALYAYYLFHVVIGLMSRETLDFAIVNWQLLLSAFYMLPPALCFWLVYRTRETFWLWMVTAVATSVIMALQEHYLHQIMPYLS